MAKVFLVLMASIICATTVYASTSLGQVTTGSSTPVTNSTISVVSTQSPIQVGQSYSMIQLLQMGYAVEAKGFAEGEAIPGGIAKSAVWKTNGDSQDFWQGIVTSNGLFILKQQLSGPENATVVSSDWKGSE